MSVDNFPMSHISSPYSASSVSASPGSTTSTNMDSGYEWGSVPLQPAASDWDASVPSGGFRSKNHGLSVAIPGSSNISLEPISSASPSQLFAAPQAENYESLYSGTNGGWGAIMAAQSLYSSPSVDPFAQLNKDKGTGFLSGVDYLNVKTAFPDLSLPDSSLSVPTIPTVDAAFGLPPAAPMSTDPAPAPQLVIPPPPLPIPAASLAAPAPAPAPASKTSKGSALTSKRRRNAPTEDVIAKRRQKHNEIEIRRRQRLNDNFDDLQTLIQYEKKEKDKDSVLRAAIDRLRLYQNRMQELEKALQQKQLVAVQRPITVLPPSMPNYNSKVNHNVIFSNNDVPMAVANLRGKLLDANGRFCDLLGYDLVSLRQVPCVQLTHPDDIPDLFESLKKLLSGAITSFTASRRMLTAARRYVHFSNTIWLVKEGDAQVPKYIMGIFIPVSIGDVIPESQIPKALPAPYGCKDTCALQS